MVDVLGLFRAIERDVFRLETLQTYDVSFEVEQLEAFRRSEPLPDTPALLESRRVTAELSTTGRRIWRVHLIDLPVSDYLLYEFAAYEANIAAGEEVFLADRTGDPELAELRDDFALFDDSAVLLFRYDDEGRLLGYDYDDTPASVARCRAARDLAASRAVPYEEFVKTRGVR